MSKLTYSSSSLTVMQIHQSKTRGAIFLRIDKLPCLFDAVIDILGAATPGPFAVLFTLDVIARAHGQLTFCAVPGDCPSQRSRVYRTKIGSFAISYESKQKF